MFPQKPVQNPVHELRGLTRTKAFCQLHGFVDCDEIRRIAVQDFKGPQAEHVPIRRRHPLQRPVVRTRNQVLVQLRSLFADSINKLARKVNQILFVMQAAL